MTPGSEGPLSSRKTQGQKVHLTLDLLVSVRSCLDGLVRSARQGSPWPGWQQQE